MAVAIMVVAVLVSIFGVYDFLLQRQTQIELQAKTGDREAHRKVTKSLLRILEYLMPVLTSLECTAVVRISSFYFVCDMEGDWKEGDCYAPYEQGSALCLAVLLVAYIWIVIPFAVVSGDVRYVQRAELWNPRAWQMNCHLKTDSLRLGYLDLDGWHAFRLELSLLVLKVGLPMIDLFVKPAKLKCAISYAMFVAGCSCVILWGEGFASQAMNALFRGSVLAVDWVFAVALFAALPQASQLSPLLLGV